MATRIGSILLALTLAAPAAASSPRLLVASPERFAAAVEDAAREGLRVRRLAVPFDRAALPDTVFAILAPEQADALPAVIVESDPFRAAEAIEAAAASKLALVDVTLVAGRFGRTFVAVFEPRPDPQAIRFIRTTGQAREWKLLEAAFRDGFGLRRILSLPDPSTNATGEVVFVLEAGAGTVGTEIDLAFESHETALNKALGKKATKGFAPIGAWPTTTQVSVLLARPPGITTAAAPVLDFDPLGAGLGDGPMGCELVALLAFQDQEVAICGAGAPPRRSSFEAEVLDRDLALTRDPWDVERVDDRLMQWANDGLVVETARLRRDAEGRLRLWLMAVAR
jgi:hypothetical protein